MKFSWDVLTIQLRHPFILSDSHITQRQVVIVRVSSDGLEGLGEAAPSSYFGETCASVTSMYGQIGAWLEEQGTAPSLTAIERHLIRLFPAHPSARSGILMALADWKAKSLDRPLWKMLELESPPAHPTSFTIGIDSPEILQIKLHEASDFEILKIKMGRGDQDYDILETVRSVTDKPLRIDVNEGWTFDEAVAKIKWLGAHAVEMVEQPLAKEDVGRMEHLRKQSVLPIFGDENILTLHDIERWNHAFDGINVKLDKCGGILEAVRMLKTARSRGLRTMLGCMVQTSVGITAASHLGSLTDFVDLDGHLLITNDPFIAPPIENGRLTVPTGPGIGVVPS